MSRIRDEAPNLGYATPQGAVTKGMEQQYNDD
jgi:hypothetical protein